VVKGMTEPSYTTTTVKPEIAQVKFHQPRHKDQHLYEEELRIQLTNKWKILEHYLQTHNLVAVSEVKVETEILPEYVCEKQGCKNILIYDDYKLAILHCQKDHPSDVYFRLTTLGMIWCLTVDKKYASLKGKLMNSKNEYTFYNMESIKLE
jgi:hypothetical protein